MSSPKKSKLPLALLAVAGLGVVGYFAFKSSGGAEERDRREQTAAVAVAPIEHRAIELQRVFSGALEAHSKFVVAPKVAGRVKDIPVDISDVVQRGDPVAILDAAEFDQAVRQAQADLAVAEANLAEAKSALEITLRADQRTSTLRERGIASETEYDNVQAELLARQAQVKVAEAQVIRAESSLESARIRLSYTRITADWSGDEDRRVVAERYVDEGETVIPYAALARRGADTGTFIVSADGTAVRWQSVETGIRSDDSVQILDADLSGRVVVLGQHLLDDGSAITIPDETPLGLEL